jgi:heme oxygenase
VDALLAPICTTDVHDPRAAGRLRAVMMDPSPRERWDVWMVQAQRFARRENYIDALGRVRLVLREVDEAIESATGEERTSLERYRARAERRATQIRAAFEAWNAKIAARRQSWTDASDEEMKRPLPLGPGEHI